MPDLKIFKFQLPCGDLDWGLSLRIAQPNRVVSMFFSVFSNLKLSMIACVLPLRHVLYRALPYKLESRLLVSLLVTPVILPKRTPYITAFKEFRPKTLNPKPHSLDLIERHHLAVLGAAGLGCGPA